MTKTKVVSIVEARMRSTRLPGKVMLPFCGKPDLQIVIERLKRSRLTDEIVLATTVNKDDDVLVNLVQKLNIAVHRGSEDDVLKRIVEAGKIKRADVLVRITADCPAVDWRIVDNLVREFKRSGVDIVSNVISRSFPIGFEVEVCRFDKLSWIEERAKDRAYQEHVTLYFYTHPKLFKLKNYFAKGKMVWPELRVALDTSEDYEFLKKVFYNLYRRNPDFSAEEVVDLVLLHPEWVKINQNVEHKDPYREITD